MMAANAHLAISPHRALTTHLMQICVGSLFICLVIVAPRFSARCINAASVSIVQEEGVGSTGRIYFGAAANSQVKVTSGGGEKRVKFINKASIFYKSAIGRKPSGKESPEEVEVGMVK